MQAEIGKRQYVVHLADVEAEEGQEYLVSLEGYEGVGELVYTYYLDENCTQEYAGKLQNEGVYSVRGVVAETECDALVVSNTAKITIREKVSPSTAPSPSQKSYGKWSKVKGVKVK